MTELSYAAAKRTRADDVTITLLTAFVAASRHPSRLFFASVFDDVCAWRRAAVETFEMHFMT